MVILEIIGGPCTGQLHRLAPGKILHLGRDPQADVALESDPALAPFHCSVQSLGNACKLNDLDSPGSTRINGQTISQSIAVHDDRIEIGGSVVLVRVEPDDVEPPAPEATRRESMSEFGIRMDLELPADIPQSVDLDDTPLECYRALRAAELFDPALTLLAHWLPKPLAVAWTVDCLRKVLEPVLTDEQQTALGIAQSWSDQPAEDLRRQAEAATLIHPADSSVGMLLRAVYCSEGSLAPVGYPEAPPAEDMTGKAIDVTLRLAPIDAEQAEPSDWLLEFLQRAEELFDLDALDAERLEPVQEVE